jgi:hypothetical protein
MSSDCIGLALKDLVEIENCEFPIFLEGLEKPTPTFEDDWLTRNLEGECSGGNISRKYMED